MAVVAVVALVFLGWLGWTAWSHSTPVVSSDLVSFEVVDEHTATARLEVRVRDGADDASCLLRAFAEDHVVVGERSFRPAPQDGSSIDETVRTDRRATSVELVGCTAEGQPRPR